MATDVELKEGQQRIEKSTDVELHEGQQWIENEFWALLPGKKDKAGNKIQWNWNIDYRQHTMRAEVDGKQGRCDFSDNDVTDCLADRTVQKRVKRLIKNLAQSLGL